MPQSEQVDLFGEPMTETVVNVASVPHRSPFRYRAEKPGLSRASPVVRSLEWKPDLFIEPFTGGGIIALTVAFEHLAKNVIMVELDEDVAAVWETMLGKNNEWLATQIEGFEVRRSGPRSRFERTEKHSRAGFPNHREKPYIPWRHSCRRVSPIPAGRENGKGIKSRWYGQHSRSGYATYEK